MKHSHMPDYEISSTPKTDILQDRSRGTIAPEMANAEFSIPALEPEVYDIAHEAAPGWDVRYIEREWRAWATEPLQQPGNARVSKITIQKLLNEHDRYVSASVGLCSDWRTTVTISSNRGRGY